MCKAFSCIISKRKKVTWRLNIDGHHELIDLAGYKDTDDCKNFVRVEISPDNNNYLSPDKWVFKIDETERPRWFSPEHEQCCWTAFKIYEKQLYNIVQKDKKIIHPFKDIKIVRKVTIKQKLLLKQWDSVWDSVWGSVRGYVGSFFHLDNWRYIKHKKGIYPFQPVVDLWNQGLVPSFDGSDWRLHSGRKAKVVFKISQKELKQFKEK